MNHFKQLLIVGLSVFTILNQSSFAAPPKSKASTTAQLAWSKKMKDMVQVLQGLLIDTSSDDKFNSKKNQARIEQNAKKLADLAHELSSAQVSPTDPDPSLIMISRLFSRESDRAYHELERGNRPYARTIIRSITGYCIACHTRSGLGGKVQNLPLDNLTNSLRPVERADFFISTRQFDRAFDEYGKVISALSTNPKGGFLDWERAIRNSLAIAVRVDQKPARALEIVNQVIAAPKAPQYLKDQARQWQETLKQWETETPSNEKNEEFYYKEAMRLILQAKGLQKFPTDRSADILYLRASSSIHDLLRVSPNGKYSDEAYYLAGLCYEALRDLNIWGLSEFYYSACIYKAPHSEVARKCFRQYEEKVYQGYTGSSGTQLPADVEKNLQELEGMSNELTGTSKPKVD